MTPHDHRTLTFANLDEVVAEAERLLASATKTIGNHSLAEILNHLAKTHDLTSGRLEGPRAPWFMKLMRPILRWYMLNPKPLKPGFKLNDKSESFFWPKEQLEVENALAYLKESVSYYQERGPLEVHPFLGRISREDNEALHCRHAALHLGFVVAAGD